MCGLHLSLASSFPAFIISNHPAPQPSVLANRCPWECAAEIRRTCRHAVATKQLFTDDCGPIDNLGEQPLKLNCVHWNGATSAGVRFLARGFAGIHATTGDQRRFRTSDGSYQAVPVFATEDF